jgi:hypothetical protein
MSYDVSPNGMAQPVVVAYPVMTAVPTRVASSVADTLILAANQYRRGATIFNTETSPLQLLLAPGVASSTNFTIQIAPSTYFEVPFGYTGVIRGLWTAVTTGAAQVTEFAF